LRGSPAGDDDLLVVKAPNDIERGIHVTEFDIASEERKKIGAC